MGGRGSGPRPTPKAILEARGSWRANDANHSAELPATGEPVKPDWLAAPSEVAIWNELVAMLQPLRIAGFQDSHSMAVYARTLAMYIHLSEEVIAGDFVSIDDEGEARMDPRLKAVMTCIDKLQRYEKAFGLTPAARVGLGRAARAAEKESGETDKEDPSRFIKFAG